MKDKALIFISILFAVAFFFLVGYFLGTQKNYQNVTVEKNQLIMEMDKSCYEQFQNNMDKTLFLKLNFE